MEIEKIAWDPLRPAFHVTDPRESDASVRAHLSHPHLYYLGSHQGCGCGFQAGQYPEFEDDPEELRATAEDRQALAEFLERLLACSGSVELYACWDGDQAEPRTQTVHLLPAHFADRFFVERERIVVSAPGGA